MGEAVLCSLNERENQGTETITCPKCNKLVTDLSPRFSDSQSTTLRYIISNLGQTRLLVCSPDLSVNLRVPASELLGPLCKSRSLFPLTSSNRIRISGCEAQESAYICTPDYYKVHRSVIHVLCDLHNKGKEEVSYHQAIKSVSLWRKCLYYLQ